MMLEIKIDTHSHHPIYKQISEEVRHLIYNGQLRPGEQIPSVRELASWLQVNPSTIAKAYYDLKLEGLVVTSRRRGTIINGKKQGFFREAVLNFGFAKAPDANLVKKFTRYSESENVETAFTLHVSPWRVQRIG